MYADLVNVFLQVPNFIFLKDLNSRYLACNQQLAEVAGCKSPEELRGKTDFDLVWAQFADLYQYGDQEVLDGKDQLSVVEPLLQADGRRINIIVNKTAFYDRQGQKIGIIGSYMEEKRPKSHGAFNPEKQNIPLTARQLDCLCYLAKGMTAKQIALELGLSRRTVETHMEVLKLKFKASTKIALIKKAWSCEFVREKILEIS